MKKLWSKTVWAPDGVRAEDWRFRGIFRFVLPLTDLFFLFFGAAGWANGVGTVERATGSDWQTGWSAAIAVSALCALIGVVFPALWSLELGGKIPLIGLVTVYIATLLFRGVVDGRVLATAGLILILILLPIWRVGDLGVVARRGVS
jgi:hypothetical protein